MANIRHHKALWRNPHTWYITAIVIGCSIFYYLGTIIALTGWGVPRWGVLYTVYDLHRLLFVIPVLYAAYIFRVRGVIVAVLISMAIVVPRAMFISPYPQPLVRSLVFIGAFGIVGTLLALLLDNLAKVELLKRSEERFRALIESGLDFLMVLNSNGTIRFASLSIERRLGYKPAELIDKHVFEFIHQQDLPNFGDVFTELVHNPDASQRIELRLQHKDGSWHAIEGIGKNLLNDPLVAGVVINCHDVTERKQAEEELSEREERYRRLFEQSPVGIGISSLDGKVFDANKAMEAITGYSIEEFKNINLADTYENPKDRKALFETLNRCSSVAGYPVRLKRKGGTVYDALLTISRLRLKGEEVFETICEDITERKRAEEALKESEQRYRQLFESVPDAVMVYGSQGRFLDCNGLTLSRLGYSREEFLRLGSADIVHPDFHQLMRDNQGRIWDGESIIVESAHVCKGGRVIPVEVNARRIHYKGEPAILAVVRDVTERKRAQGLQQELNLSSRLASIGRLAAGVAHEINNPLTAIRGFSQRLLRKSTDAKVNRDLEIIRSEARRAANVVENLLTFARRREPKKEYSDINDIVQRALQLRVYELKTNNIEVVTDLTPSCPKTMVDFHQIQQVFLNLILNAEQAMTEVNRGGKLTIKTRGIKDYIRISFTDDGLGIPAEHLDKVFDPFFTTRGEGGGTGLGLSVCHGIVAEHGGRIYARSKPVAGTTLFVELPITTEEMGKSKVVEE